MPPCNCTESVRLGMAATQQVLRTSFDLYHKRSGAVPAILTCSYCDRVIRGIEYGLRLEAVYPKDIAFRGEYFVDIWTLGCYVALRPVYDFGTGKGVVRCAS